MDNDSLIDKLQKKTFKNYLDDTLDRELLLSNQINYNDISVGVILNKIIDKNVYEVYFYVKTINKTACPFKYSLINIENTAKTEYFKNKKFIENTNFDDIIKAFI